MLKFLGWIFGRKDTQECQSDPNHEILAISYADRNNATANQNDPYSDLHQVHTSYDLAWGTQFLSSDQKFNCPGSLNVSSNFKDRSPTSSVFNKQEELVVNSSSNIKSEKIIVDSEIKPRTRVGTFERRVVDCKIMPNTGLRTFENWKVDQDSHGKPELHSSLASSSVSSKLPLHPSILPPPKLCSLPPSSFYEIPPASLNHHSVTSESTSVLASYNLTTLETGIKHIEIDKSDSHLHEVTDDIQNMIKGDNFNSSVRSSLSGKTLTSPMCPPNSDIAAITSDSSDKKTLQAEVLDISVKKAESLSYDVTDDCRGTDTRGIVPLVLEKNSSLPTPKLDSSSPIYSLERHLASPKCSSSSKKPTVSVPSKAATQRPKSKSMWVHKGAASCCVVSEDTTNFTSIDIALGDLQKPFAEASPKSDLSLSSSSFCNSQLHEVDDIHNFSKRNKSDSSVTSCLLGKTLDPPNFNKAAITSNSSKKKTLQTEILNMSVKKDDSLYVVADNFKDANTRSIAPLIFKKPYSSSTPALDSSSPLPSVDRHLTSPKCSSFSKSPVSFNSTTQQTKNKSIWVQKGASSRCVVSEDYTNLTSIDNAQEDFETPISEAFHKSDLSLSSSLFSTTLHPPKHSPISKNPTKSFASSKSTNQQTKANCVWVKKGASSPHSLASEDSENFIKINIVPELLGKPPSPSSPVSYPSSYETPPTSPKFSPIFKPTLSSDSSSSTSQQNKTKYMWVEKGTLPLYTVPEDFKDLIKQDIVPEVLKKPLSPLTYKDYFAALLYAEDYYIEKWDGFEIEDVSMEVKIKNISLELHRAEIHGRNGKSKSLYRTFVQFEIESIPEKRPFLLSKDFAYVRPSGTEDTPFKGIIYRIVKSNHLLVDFGKDFYEQHYSECKYDVKFSLNRVCLKRAHKAVEAASDVVFRNFLFPNVIPRSNDVSLEELHPLHLTLKQEQICAVHRIVMHQGPSPYLVEGPLSVSIVRKELISEAILTTTGEVIQVAVLQLLGISPLSRILICALSNSACDALMRNLQKEIPISDMFRSNAAFRGLDEVPDDILPHCPYEEEQELFPCPPLAQLEKYKIILSTFMSTFRLHHEGLKAGHFSHIFLVDASSAIEPETLVPLSNLANEKTVIVVTGKPGDSSRWIRSIMARNNGLRTSYFERLRKSELYMTLNPQAISQLSS